MQLAVIDKQQLEVIHEVLDPRGDIQTSEEIKCLLEGGKTHFVIMSISDFCEATGYGDPRHE